MAWNADATRLPYRMHSEYLRKLFLHNDLAEGRYVVEGKPIALSDLRAPIFVVGTVRDHVAPWKSTYKIHYQVEADVTYLLTSGGHNAGIVAPPGAQGHFYQVKTKAARAAYVGPDESLKNGPEGRRVVVAGMDEVAHRPIRRAMRAAANGCRTLGRPDFAGCPGRLCSPITITAALRSPASGRSRLIVSKLDLASS
jgi:hypothetical protein